MHKEGDTITPSAAAWELSARYDEVMVDEYQDSNLVQEMITNLVAGWADKRKNIFMVGDVKQSNYRFRLARPLFTGRQRGTENRSAQKLPKPWNGIIICQLSVSPDHG